MSEVHNEALYSKLRQKLNSENVKLWLPPYTRDGGEKGDIPNDLIERYSQELSLPSETVQKVIEDLRQHALNKLAAKKRFTETGVATLNMKLAGSLPDSVRETYPNHIVIVNISLKNTGADLKAALNAQTQIETVNLKLISSGRLVEDELTLEEQGIKNTSTIMSLVLNESKAEAQSQDHQMANIAKTLKAAEYLARNKRDNAEEYLHITDQRGKSIDLPEEEKQALAFAMALHEKGRAALKRKEYATALLLLLEAEKEFTKCRADILQAVDNYALVCLDIVWCHLCLRNIDCLPDAESKLKTCEDCFKRCYGDNLERLVLVKGCTGEEQALLLRLHLLQGILAYYQHHADRAIYLLNLAKQELCNLQVDENKMTEVMSVGFSQLEARLGLRACHGDVQAAISYILKRKEEKSEIRAKEKENRKRRKLAKRLGKTQSGEEVNVSYYESLMEMGYGKGAAAAALRQTDNDLMAAIQVLTSQRELLDLPDPEFKVTDEMLSQLTAMGFDEVHCRAALYQFHGDVQRCIDEMLNLGGIVPQTWIDVIPSTSSEESNLQQFTPEEKATEREAIDMIASDLPEGEEDHLDLDLNEEAGLLQQYLSLLISRQ